MRYYPLLLDLQNKKCVVAGGGQVAQRKARSLINCGAKVKVISPSLNKGLLRFKKEFIHIKSGYRPRLIEGAFLVIAATADRKVNSRISSDAQRLGVLVNVVDSPGESNFIVPSSIRKKDLIISVSTSGKAPALSKRIRKDLNQLLFPDYAKFLKILSRIRGELKLRCSNPNIRGRIMNYLTSGKIQ